jgi:transposase
VVIAPETTACPCCHGAMHVIGEDRSERLVAHVLVTKYADHAPLYRQAQMLTRQGISSECRLTALYNIIALTAMTVEIKQSIWLFWFIRNDF